MVANVQNACKINKKTLKSDKNKGQEGKLWLQVFITCKEETVSIATSSIALEVKY